MLGNDDGTASIEFALVATLLLAILFGTFVYGHYFAVRIALVHSASEGARASVAGITDGERATLAAGAVDRALDAYGNFLPRDGVTVSAHPVAGETGQFSVTVGFDFDRLGYGSLHSLVPLPDSQPAHTAVAARGGY